MENKKLRIGTRGSQLALWQANHLSSLLQEYGVDVEICVIKTKGDRIDNVSFDKIEGKSFFTKEIEDALLKEEVDVAVHSMKDLSTEGVEGLVLAAVSERANPCDTLLIREDKIKEKQVLQLGEAAVLGTSSVRRRSQILDMRPDLQIEALRGNINTRIQKLLNGNYDAIILAQAGLDRISPSLEGLRTFTFQAEEFVPAPAQGILAFQCRENDMPVRRLLKKIHHPETGKISRIERAILKEFGGGCQLPLGVYCKTTEQNHYRVSVAYQAENHSLLKFHEAQKSVVGLAESIVNSLKNKIS